VKILRNILIIFCLSLLSACIKEPPGLDQRQLGTSAYDLLSSAKYKSLNIEINYMPGYEPDAVTVNKLIIFLEKLINKPGGITVSKHIIPVSSLEVLALDNIIGLENIYRQYHTQKDVITAHVLITNGYYKNNVLATSYWDTSICIFGKSIDERSGNTGQISRSALMTILLEHEFGHLLGLVSQGTPMRNAHRDFLNGAHCKNSNCLMYYNVEEGFANSQNNIPLLDADCLADLKANGGK
jgi:hypothetical protein